MITKLRTLLLVFIFILQFSCPLFAEEKNELPQNLVSAHIESKKEHFKLGLGSQKTDVELFFIENIPSTIKDGELNIQIVGRPESSDRIHTVKPLFISGQPQFITNDAVKIDNITLYENRIKLNLHRLNSETASFSISGITMGVKESNRSKTCDIILSGTALGDNNASLTIPDLFEFVGPITGIPSSYILCSVGSKYLSQEVAFCSQQPKIYATTYTDVGPYLNHSGDIMVPVHCFYNSKMNFNRENFHFLFSQGFKQLTFTEKSRRLVITAGSKIVQKECCLMVNGKPTYIKAADLILSSPAESVNNKIYISARDLALLNNWTLSLNNKNELRFYEQ